MGSTPPSNTGSLSPMNNDTTTQLVNESVETTPVSTNISTEAIVTTAPWETTSLNPTFTSSTTSTGSGPNLVSPQVPNPGVGVYVVVVFLVVVGFVIMAWIAIMIKKKRQRDSYTDPARSTMRGGVNSENFENPIKFSDATYSSAVI